LFRETKLDAKAAFHDLCLVPGQGRNVNLQQQQGGRRLNSEKKEDTVFEQHQQPWLLLWVLVSIPQLARAEGFVLNWEGWEVWGDPACTIISSPSTGTCS